MTVLAPPDQSTRIGCRLVAVPDEGISFTLAAYPERQPLSWRVTGGLVQMVALPVVVVGTVASILVPDRYWLYVLVVMVIAITVGTFALAQVWNTGVPPLDRDLWRGGVGGTNHLDRLSERASLGSPQAIDPASLPTTARPGTHLASTNRPRPPTTFPSSPAQPHRTTAGPNEPESPNP